MISKQNILGVDITNATKKEVLEYIIKNLENFQKKRFLVTPNPEFLVLANKNLAFKNVLNKADLASVDGVGAMIAAKILGKPLKERFAGVDMVESVCKEVSEKPITVGFLGGRDGVAERTAECLLKKHPKLKVAFVGEEWPREGLLGSTRSLKDFLKPSGNASARQTTLRDDVRLQNSKEQSHISASLSKNQHQSVTQPIFNSPANDLPRSSIDILFVAFGCPKQEFWINENLNKIPVKIAIGVGGAFDYISGRIPRAPVFIRKIGMEWLFRLIVQPWRIKRQLALSEFIWLVIKEKLSQN